MNTGVRAVIGAGSVVLLVGCGDDGTGPELAKIESVTVSPQIATVELGNTIQLQATVRDAAGRIVGGQRVTWSSSQPAVATVDSTGLVTGLAEGSASITASADAKSASATVVVVKAPVCSSPSSPLPLGWVTVLDTVKVSSSCAFLSAGSGNAQYLVVPFTANFEVAGEFEVTLRGFDLTFRSAPAVGRAVSAPDAFHSLVRRFEGRLARAGATPAWASARVRPFAVPTLGQVDSFYVIQQIDSIERVFNNPRTSDFARVGATLKFIGQRSLLYLDRQAPAGGLTDADLQEIGQIYDGKLYDVATRTFGQPSDVNSDGRVTILLTPRVNALTPDTATAVIVGFFFGLDLFARTSASCPPCRFSNEQEMFYGLVPDTGAVVSGRRSTATVKRILPPVMIHETQHMISFNQRVFVRGGLPELLWLNEALSHIAEELGGDAFAAEGNTTKANDFYEQNFKRAIEYLKEPWKHSLTSTTGGGTLGERGAGWLFLRWLGDQYGVSIYGQLVSTTDEGVRNVKNRTGRDFFVLFGEWVVTLYSEDLSIAGLSDRFQIKKWALRSQLVSDGRYALQPLEKRFSDLDGASLRQMLKGSSPFHVLLTADRAEDITLDLALAGKGGLALLRTR